MSTINEGKLFAEFMECDIEGDNIYISNYAVEESVLIDELQYHLSWDWLMPVRDKIQQTTEYDVMLQGISGCLIWNAFNSEDTFSINVDDETSLKATYKAILELLKWLKFKKEGL